MLYRCRNIAVYFRIILFSSSEFFINSLYKDILSVFQIDYMVPTTIADEMSYM